MLVICQSLVSLEHENMIFEKHICMLFLCKNVEIVPEFVMLGCLGWFGNTEKKVKKNTVKISDSIT